MAMPERKVCTCCWAENVIEDFRWINRARTRRRSVCSVCDKRRRSIYEKSERGKRKRMLRVKRNPRTRFRLLRKNARQRGIDVLLTFEQYVGLTNGACCRYCKNALPPEGSGVDRIDPSQSYAIANLVPCCGFCNFTKSGIWSFKEMVEVIGPAVARVMEDRRRNGGNTTHSAPHQWNS